MKILNFKVAIGIIAIAALVWFGFTLKQWAENGRYQAVFVLDNFRYIARLDTRTGKIEPFIMDNTGEIVSFEEYLRTIQEPKKSREK